MNNPHGKGQKAKSGKIEVKAFGQLCRIGALFGGDAREVGCRRQWRQMGRLIHPNQQIGGVGLAKQARGGADIGQRSAGWDGLGHADRGQIGGQRRGCGFCRHQQQARRGEERGKVEIRALQAWGIRLGRRGQLIDAQKP